jgi:predicted nucleic acid-binding protein
LIESFFEKYLVIEASKAVFLSASHLRQRYSLSYWDSQIVASALQAGVSVLYSEDMQHGLKVDRQLEVVNPLL